MRLPRPSSAFSLCVAALLSLPASASLSVVSTVTVAGSGGGADSADGIAQDASGNIFVAGALTQAGTGSDIWLAKYDQSLVLQSTYTYDKSGFGDQAYKVAVDSASGNVFVVGFVGSSATSAGRDAWVAKFNSSLVLLSSVTVNGSANDDDEATSLRVYGGSVFVVGMSSTTTGWAHWLARYDTNLVLLASSTVVEVTPYTWDVLPQSNGSVWVVGSRAPNTGTSNDAWIGKYNSSLVLVSSRAVNGPSSQSDELKRLEDDGAGGVYAVGFLYTPTAADGWIVHYDSSMVVVSSTLVNGPGNANEYFSSILKTSSGTYLVGGDYGEVAGLGGINAIISEYSSGLALLSSTVYTSSGSTADHAYSLLQGLNGDVYAAGYTTGGTQDAWLARFTAAVATGSYAGCTTTRNVGAGQTFATIQAAVNTLPASLAGPACVVIRDGATYAEQVTVQNFTNNGSSISIFADPASGLRPAVSPSSGSTGAFVIKNASVSVSGLDVVPTTTTAYGVFVSSPYASLSSLNVKDAGGLITSAGVRLGSWASVDYTSVTVGNVNTSGIWLASSSMTAVTHSSVSASGPTTGHALWLNGASSNTISNFFGVNVGAGLYASIPSSYNTVTLSTFNSTTGTAALYFNGGSYNTLSQLYVSNTATDAMGFSGSSYNTVTLSTMVTGGAGGSAAIMFSASSSNTVTQVFAKSASIGVDIINSVNNAVSVSTIIGGSGFEAINLSVASSNSFTQDYISNAAGAGGVAILYASSAVANNVSQSVLVAGYGGLAAEFASGSSGNTISQSTLMAPLGYGAWMWPGSNANAVSQSTIASSALMRYGIYIQQSSGNVFTSDYVLASTAASVSSATGTVITASVLVTTNPAGSALLFDSQATGLTLTSTTLTTSVLGTGINIATGAAGALVFANDTVTGSRYGLLIATASAGASLTANSLTFSNLAAGATAINFLGGTFVSTFTAVSFDSTPSVNVNGSALNAASRITMNNATGARVGPPYENDPASLVDWVGLASSPTAPSGFAGTALSASSIQWSWVDNSSNETGFRVLFGTINVSGDLGANTTVWIQTGLSTNTAYGPYAAQAFNSTGTANSSTASRFTLATVPTGLAASGVTASSATLSWSGNGTTYQLERSTGAGFTVVYTSAAPTYGDTALAAGTTYWFRVAALNGDAVATAYASSITFVTAAAGAAPPAPSGFAGTALSASSIQWSWVDNSSNETGFRVLSGTINVSGDLAANTTVWLQTGLSTNTAYGPYAAQAFNSTGTANSSTASRFSLATVPTGLAASGVTASSATLSWSGNGTTYQLERSTGAGFAVVYTSSAPTYGDTALAAGTTYWFRVAALNGDALATSYASSITFVTPAAGAAPAAPSGFAGIAQSVSSIQWSWVDNSSNETGFRVVFGTVNVSGDLAANATSWLQTGLSTNTAYGPYAAEAFNSTGTADSASLTRYTAAAAPSAMNATAVAQTSVTINWNSNNPGGTFFSLERSTGAGFAVLSTNTAVSYGDTGLNGAATYYYRVRASNGDGVYTAYASSIAVVTLPNAPPVAPSGFAGAAVSATAVQWSWNDNASNETGYRVMSAATNVSGDLAANTTVWLQTGLATNTATGPYYVRAFNVGGAVDSSSATRSTLAVPPAGLGVSGVQQTSATLSWSSGGNPGSTAYELERSTGGVWTLLLSTTALSYLDQGLTPSATHYWRVLARNGDGIASAYSSTVSAVALSAPAIPGAAGTPVGTALGVSSVSWTWVLASGATTHYLFRPSDLSILGSSIAGPFVQTALSPNVAYGLKVAGKNLGGVGPLSPSATVYTLAAAPSSPVASSQTATTMLLSWGLNGNPGTTTAQLDRSTSGVSYSTFAAGALTSAMDSGLVGCTTYYYRVRNLNGDGLATPYAAFTGVTANTVPDPPSGLTAQPVAGGKVQLAWSPSATEGVTGYLLYTDGGSGTVSYAAPYASIGSTQTSFTTGVLSSSAAYAFSLRAAHRCGTVETAGAFAVSGASATLASVRAVVKEPDSGKRINGNRVTILGELVAGTPSDAQQLLFQFKTAAATAWTTVPAANVNHPNPDYDFPYFTHWDVTALPGGSYDLRVVAYDRGGVPDPAPSSVRVIVDAVTPDVSEGLDGSGKVKKDQTISNAAVSVVETAGAAATDAAVRVTIPAGVVTAGTCTVSVIANPSITTAAPAGQSMIGSSIKIDLSNGQSALNGTAAITLTYPTTVLFPSQLQIFYLNEATGQWSRDFNSTVDTASHTVTGLTPHFSTFALMLGTSFSPDLDGVRVYPVPYKPNGTNPDEGVPFSAGNANSGIIFDNLAAAAEITIYTLSGRMVASMSNPTPVGVVRWDARNQDGRDVASGAYFAVIKAPGHSAVTRKLVIIR